jgi:cytochrome c biogenesis protein CcmG/thiol:disulfide interchange protein DsbE
VAEAVARARNRWLFLLPVAAFFALAVLFLARLVAGGDPSRVPSALIGRPVPAFSLPAVEGLLEAGRPVPGLDSADFKGQVTVVNVWGSWCVPCRDEHPFLMELARDRGIRLVGVNQKDNPENARRFLGQFGNPFAAVGADANGRASIELGVYGVPETFIVGPDGTIRHKQIGPLTAATLPAFTEALRKART